MFLKDKYKHKELNLDNNFAEKHFWVMFINGNLLPPMKFNDNNTNEYIEFKSFNSKFLLWLFSKKGAKEFYDLFIKEQGKAVLSHISTDYNLSSIDDINQLEYYMNNLAYIFDLQTVSVANEAPGNQSDNHSLGKAPMPSQDIFALSSPKKKYKKDIKDDSDSEDGLVRLNRNHERSREMDYLNFDAINYYGQRHNDAYSSNSEEE